MSYRVIEEIPQPERYIEIRLRAGLSRKSLEAARIGLKNSLYGVTAYFDDEPVGIGRVIGDGGCFFEIVDIAVVPEHQKQGLGRAIMDKLMVYIQKTALPTAYISLMADHGTPQFYAKWGFQYAQLPEKSGMYLRIQ